jgi:hypothetical protein
LRIKRRKTTAAHSRRPATALPPVACSICGTKLDDFFRPYRYPVCRQCDERAVTAAGQRPHTAADDSSAEVVKGTLVIHDAGDYGDNPVFIDGRTCWRRYKFGGWVTICDPFDCATILDFYEKLEAQARG